MWHRRGVAIISAMAVFAAGRVLADLDGSYVLPLDDLAIQYASRPLADPVTELEQRIQRGEAKLEYDADYGYLPSVLRNLKAPVSSQLLVFSKTSFQAPRISPQVPRALYFNDNVAVGWVKGGDVVEIASVDPRQGVIFYTLDQEQVARPRIVRRDECLQCHASGGTLGVPGLVIRSVYPDRSGMPLFHAGSFIIDHRSPISQRWGGYYVDGSLGSHKHMGNAIYQDTDPPQPEERRFNAGDYLSPYSDVVALMVMEHQSRMQNLITRVGFETRMALESQAAINQALKQPNEMSESTTRRINSAAEALVTYMLFGGEAALECPIKGASNFTAEFEKQGPRDKRGRSLRQFDLTRRMFRYPCSHLIYSASFDHLPDLAKQRVYRRLWDVLSGEDHSPAFAHLSSADRQAIREILRDTKNGLPDYWSKPVSRKL